MTRCNDTENNEKPSLSQESATTKPPTSHRGHSCNLVRRARRRSQECRASNQHQCRQALNQTPCTAASQRASTATSAMSAPPCQMFKCSDQAGSSNANASNGDQHAHELPPAAPRAAMFRPERRRANEQEKIREAGGKGDRVSPRACERHRTARRSASNIYRSIFISKVIRGSILAVVYRGEHFAGVARNTV